MYLHKILVSTFKCIINLLFRQKIHDNSLKRSLISRKIFLKILESTLIPNYGKKALEGHKGFDPFLVKTEFNAVLPYRVHNTVEKEWNWKYK